MFEPIRYAALFVFLGVLSAGSAALLACGSTGSAVWLLVLAQAYVSACLFAMAAAYTLNHYGLHVEGAIHRPGLAGLIGPLILPYRLLARGTCALLARHDPMEMMHPVAHRLFVGRIPHPSERGRLEEAGISSVLNLCAEFPRFSRLEDVAGFETIYLPVLDGTAPSPGALARAVDWIESRHREGRSVLVHCAQGRGRSVTVAAAALCRLGLAEGPEDALARIKAVRPKAKPSEKQRQALRRFLDVQPAA